MSNARVLLTGFAPFSGHGRNPSGDVARGLAREATLRAAGVVTAVLPVERRQAARALADALALHEPRTLVMAGLAANRDVLSLERFAVNRYRAAGARGAGHPIRPDGPARLRSTLPVRRSLAALQSAGVKARVSEDAGRYTCNLVLYLALTWAAAGTLPGGADAPRRVGFVHLPPTPDVHGRTAAATPLSSLRASIRALLVAWS